MEETKPLPPAAATASNVPGGKAPLPPLKSVGIKATPDAAPTALSQ